ncbi:MAG: antitoxin VapB family protein [Haloarculaceae archaeon]
MGDTSIRVSEETKDRLDLYKREGESYEDVIVRLTERDRWAGFGVLAEADGDTRDGMNEMRERMREGTENDIEGGS